MKIRILTFLKKEENFTKILIATIAFYFYKTAFWPITYLFIASYVLLLVFYFRRFSYEFQFLGFIRVFSAPIILAGIFIIVFLLSGQFSNSIVIKDILLIVVLFSLFYFLYWNNTVLNLGFPKLFTVNLIILLTAIISILNLFGQFYISILPSAFLSKLNISNESTIANDYNFFSLFFLFGLVILNFKSSSNVLSHKFPILVTFILNLFFVVNIVLSSSRRGIIILVLLMSTYIIFSLMLGTRVSSIKILYKKVISLFMVTLILFLIGVTLYQMAPKQKISYLVNRYASLLGVTEFNSIERFLWYRNTKLPENKLFLIDKYSFVENIKNWNNYAANGTSHATVDTPYGPGLKVSRENGDNGGFSLFYDGPKMLYYANHTYKITFKIKFITGSFNSFNVGWWINDGQKGFDNTAALEKQTEALGGGWYKCTSTYTFIDNHVGLTGFINSVANGTSFVISEFELSDLNYDYLLPRFLFEVKNDVDINKWMDDVNKPISNNTNLLNNGDFKFDTRFWKSNADALTIEIKKSQTGNYASISRGDGNGGYFSLYYVGRNIEFMENNEYQFSFKVKPIYPQIIPFKVGFRLDEGDGYERPGNLSLNVDTLENGWLLVKSKYKFRNSHNSNLVFPISCQIDSSKFYITDLCLVNLTYIQYQIESKAINKDLLETGANFSERTSRWLYAVEIWKNKYKWYNKLFGHGFDYLGWYGEKYLGNSQVSDWPHNPFITVLLYSGIIGLISYLWLLVKVISLYYKYRKEYTVAFVGFLITFFFSYFSGSSPFDPPIMGFFILLPFFIHSIHKNDISLTPVILIDAQNPNNRYK